MKNVHGRNVALISTLVIAAGCLTPSLSAIANVDGGTDEAVAAIAAADPTLLPESLDLSSLEDGGTDTVGTSEVDITISDELVNDIEVSADDGAELAVELPFADEATRGEVSSDGLIVFDNQNGSRTVPVPRDDGSLQINTVIESADAPSSYTYSFSTPEGTEIREEDGLVLFISSDGSLLGALAPAWAKDANGDDVVTSYKVGHDTVTQIVEHDESSVYPIVADPWLGIKLWKKITVNSYKSQPRVNLNLSSWGWAVWSGAAQGGGGAGFAAGQAILNKAGWTEANAWSSKVKNALNKKSQRQQYECHALGALFAGEWNLEKFRPNRTKHWSYGVAKHRCNWTTSNRY